MTKTHTKIIKTLIRIQMKIENINIETNICVCVCVCVYINKKYILAFQWY